MRKSILLSMGGLALGACLPALVALAHADRPCPCMHAGGLARQGETVCLEIDGQRRLARCVMVLNNSSWRFSGERCDPTASSTPATASRAAAAG